MDPIRRENEKAELVDVDYPQGLILAIGCSFSGAVMGFLFAGDIALSLTAFASLVLGLVTGWLVWGRDETRFQ